jgi:alpha-galactosidase
MSLIGRSQAGLAKFAGPGHWNDPDMLEVGNGKLTHDENLTHMTLWAMLAAPLIAGNNLTAMTDDVKGILMDKDVIAIDQDALGRQGDRVYAEGPVEIWAKPLKDGSKAVAIFNFGESETWMRGIGLHLKEMGLPTSVKARDVWGAKDLGTITDDWKTTIPRHGVVLLVVRR